MLSTAPRLTKEVIHPSLKKLVDSNKLDFTDMSSRIYLTPVESGGKLALEKSIDDKSFYSIDKTRVNYSYLASMSVVFCTLSGSSIFHILSAFVGAGLVLAGMQMEVIVGSVPNKHKEVMFGSVSFSEMEQIQFTRLFHDTIAHIVKHFPSANTMEECEISCEDIVINFLKNKMFEGSLGKAMYFVGILPVVRILYVMSFVQDGWIISKNTVLKRRKNASIYDSRSAELLLMTATTQTIFILTNSIDKFLDSKIPYHGKMKSILMQTFMNVVVDFYIRQDIQVGDEAIMKMYKNVSVLANKNKSLSSHVSNADAILAARKSDAVTMHRHKTSGTKKLRSSQMVFVVWMITLAVILSASLAMVFLEKYSALLIHSSIVTISLIIIAALM